VRAPKKRTAKKTARKPAARKATTRKADALVLCARVNDQVTLDVYDTGKVGAFFDGYGIEIGHIGPGAVTSARKLSEGLPITSFSPARKAVDKEIEALVRHLARSGFLEYRLVPPRGADMIAIEPQVRDYWPQVAKLGNADTVVLSRFAYLRRRGSELVLESPRSPALFRIADPRIAAAVAGLVRPQKIGALRQDKAFAGLALLGLLVACGILFKVGGKDEGLRAHEGDQHLVVWDFHDLLFHTRSTEGRHASPLGSRYPFVGSIAPPPAVHWPWQGEPIDLKAFASPDDEPASPLSALLQARHSVRDFDQAKPITLAELARFLELTAQVKSKWSSPLDFGEGRVGPVLDYTSRPYPSAGSAYELELYLNVTQCEGLANGFYHYDADRHALVQIAAPAQAIEAQLESAAFAMDAMGLPQILLTVAARFDRVAWKYSAIAYSLILKDVGVLLQTLSLAVTEMGLGGCAIGTGNVELFSKLTGLPFHVEGPVGQFALGRSAPAAS
jgi:SagB-type dehydrogenase family enzyme